MNIDKILQNPIDQLSDLGTYRRVGRSVAVRTVHTQFFLDPNSQNRWAVPSLEILSHL